MMISIGMNNDELELISKRIKELQGIPNMDEEQLTEYTSLFRIKDLLNIANNVKDTSKCIVVGTMRVRSKDANKLFDLFEKVNVPGLEVPRPQYNGEFIPGTKKGLKMPREKKENESFEDYENYLYKYYEDSGQYNDLEVISYHPGTSVPKLRKPYPHEMYYSTEDGYEYDDIYKGTRNAYYLSLARYYNTLLAIERTKLVKESLDTVDFTDLQDYPVPLKVVSTEPADYRYVSRNWGADSGRHVSRNWGRDLESDVSSSKVKVVSVEPMVGNSNLLNMNAINAVVQDKLKKDKEEALHLSEYVLDSLSGVDIDQIQEKNNAILDKASDDVDLLLRGKLETSGGAVSLESQNKTNNIFGRKNVVVDEDYELTADEQKALESIVLDNLSSEGIAFEIYDTPEDDKILESSTMSDDDVEFESYVTGMEEQDIYSRVPKDVLVGAGIIDKMKDVDVSFETLEQISDSIEGYKVKYPDREVVFEGLGRRVDDRIDSLKPKSTMSRVVKVEEVPKKEVKQDGIMQSFTPFEEYKNVFDRSGSGTKLKVTDVEEYTLNKEVNNEKVQDDYKVLNAEEVIRLVL